MGGVLTRGAENPTLDTARPASLRRQPDWQPLLNDREASDCRQPSDPTLAAESVCSQVRGMREKGVSTTSGVGSPSGLGECCDCKDSRMNRGSMCR